jgi:hypothetical protein
MTRHQPIKRGLLFYVLDALHVDIPGPTANRLINRGVSSAGTCRGRRLSANKAAVKVFQAPGNLSNLFLVAMQSAEHPDTNIELDVVG